MTEAYAESRGSLVTLNLVTEIGYDRAQELGLLVSPEDFAQFDLEECLSHQERLTEMLQQDIAECWTDPRNNFAVVCGTNVFAFKQPLTDFDQAHFSERQPYYCTVILKPQTANAVWIPRQRTRWLHVVPDIE